MAGDLPLGYWQTFIRTKILSSLICVLFLCGCAILSPTYSLCNDQRAQSASASLTMTVTRKEFDQMRRDCDPNAFSKWSERLLQLKEGMTPSEVNAMLKPEYKGDPTLSGLGNISGSGSHETLLLDDAFFVFLHYSIVNTNGSLRREDRDADLLSSASTPIAIKYKIR